MSSQKQVPVVDLRYMTQADIQVLAASSPTLFNFESLTTIIPSLDPPLFNEPASSRKQPFACVPLNPNSDNAELIPNSKTRRFGRHKNPNSILGIRQGEDGVENKETLQIASALRKLITSREKNEIFEKLDREVMNLKGKVVDLEELGKKEGLYEDEIGKRTEGLEKEDQLLGYLGLLDGKWGSSKKKSKMVDAGLFGCQLPKGWKVFLALKRKDRRVFLHCREFVSPSGKHFANCKEVSLYILSLNVHHGSSQKISGQHPLSASKTDKALENVTNQTLGEVSEVELGNCSSVTPISNISTECEKQGQLFNSTNRSKKYLQCQKCNLPFIDEDAQSQHSCTSQRSVKRRRLGQSFTEGVITKDGKYECQFCPKTFSEKHGFNRHVGAHKRHERLKKCNESVTEGAGSVMRVSLVPCNQSKNNISVNEKAEALIHNSSAKHVTEAVSKGGECNLNESATQGEMNISNSSSATLVPYYQPVNDISVNENTEASAHNDSAEHLTEAVSNEGKHDLNESVAEEEKNISNSSSASLMLYDQSMHSISIDVNPKASVHNDSGKHITETVSKEVEDSLKASIHYDDVSAGKFFDNSIKDDDHNSDDMKEITCNDDTMDMPSHACTNITLPSENHVNNEFNVSSPAITEAPFTKQSIHDPIIECEDAETKPGISEDLNAESEKSKIYQIYPSPSSYENKSDGVACGSMVNSKTEENHVVATEVMLMEIPEEIIKIPEGNFEGGQISDCDTNDSSDVDVTSNTMSIEANAKDVNPNTMECDGDQNKLEEHHLSFTGDEAKYCTSKENEIVESDDNMDGKIIFDCTMDNELNLSFDFPDIANEPTSGIETNADCMFPGDLDKSLLDENFDIDYEFQSYFQSRNVGNENVSSDIMDNNDGLQASQVNAPDQSSSWMQIPSLNFLDLMADQIQNSPRNEQSHLSGLDGLSLESIEPSDFALSTGQSSTLAPMEPFSEHQLERGTPSEKNPTNSAPTAVCLWCNSKFSLQGYDTEPHSGGVCYICPDCKANTSSQFGMFIN